MAGNDLYLKFSTAAPNDTGARPINPCGPPNIVWDSQSIWLSKPNDPLSTLTKATTNQQIQVNVTVTNKGAAAFTPDLGNAVFVTVQVWICNFAIAVGPDGGIASAGGSAGQDAPLTATIAAGGSQRASVLWKPAPGDLNINTTGAGEGHVCVAANVFWEGTTPAPESHRFPPPGSLSICGDGANPNELIGGHHGQKNILIAAGEARETMSIPMNVFNLAREPETFVLEAVEARGAKIALRMAEREVLLAEDFVTLRGGKTRVKPKMVDGDPVEPIERARLRAGGKMVLDRKHPITLSRREVQEFQLEGRNSEGKKIKLEVAPKRAQRVQLQWEQPAEKPGTVHVFDVVQRGKRNRHLGGARIVVVTL